MSLLSATILLFLVMDPFGNVPVFLCVLRDIPHHRRQPVILRETIIALFVLASFLLAGPHILMALQITEPSLRIAGGIILFLIAIKMIFGESEDLFRDTAGGEPLIVPLAIPCISGPASIASVMLLMGQDPGRWAEWLLALFLAWLASSVILLLSAKLEYLFGQRGLTALQHLMGLILTALAVEMFLQGINTVFFHQA